MIKMNRINNYNKEEHIQFIETLIKTEQVAVFLNNMDISERSKAEQNDTLEYLYNRIIKLQNNWNELKKYADERLDTAKYLYENRHINRTDFQVRQDETIKLKRKMQELEQGKDG